MDKRYLHTLEAGAWLPGMQSFISGFVIGLITLALAYIVRVRSPWVFAIITGGLSWVACWFALQYHWLDLTRLEGLTGLDLNRDGLVGMDPPEPVTVRVRVEKIKDNNSYQEIIYNLPGTLTQLTELARGLLLDDLPLSERCWTGSGRPFSVLSFRNLRSELIRRGLVELANEKDARQGFILTDDGRDCLGGLLNPNPSPTERG